MGIFKKTNLKVRLILIISFLFVSCNNCENCKNQDNQQPQCNLIQYEDTQDEDISINYKLIGDRLDIIKNDMYNCCAKYITISATIYKNNLYIIEKQSSTNCKCVTHKIIEYTVDNVDDIKSVYINNELKIKNYDNKKI